MCSVEALLPMGSYRVHPEDGTPLQEANGDVPLDGELEWL